MPRSKPRSPSPPVSRLLLVALGCLSCVRAVGCRTLEDPYPFEVSQVHGPADLTVRFPFGLETVHLQYVASREARPEGGAQARLRRLVERGVDVRPQLGFPLSRDQADRRQVLLYRPGSTRSINEELLEAGVARFDAQPIGPGYQGAAACMTAARRAARARTETGRVGGGPAALWTIRPADAATELRAAHELLARAGGAVRGEPVRVRLVGSEALAREEQRILGGRLRRAARGHLDAFSPPGPEIFVQKLIFPDSLPAGPAGPVRMREILRVVLLHELVHKAQYAFGMEPRIVRRDHASLALIEGHAAYWAYRLGVQAGLANAASVLLSAGAKYAEGFAVWRHIYDRLRAGGHRVDLALEGDPLVVAVHRALLGPGGPSSRSALLDPDRWLAGHVPAWPSPPFRVVLAGAVRYDVPRGRDGRGMEVRWTIEVPAGGRALFLQAERVSTLVERRSGKGWRQFGGPRVLEHGSGRLRRVVEPGEAWALPPGDRRLSSWLQPFDLDAAHRTRIRLVIDGFAVSYAEGTEPVSFGRVSSAWLRLSSVPGAGGPSAAGSAGQR